MKIKKIRARAMPRPTKKIGRRKRVSAEEIIAALNSTIIELNKSRSDSHGHKYALTPIKNVKLQVVILQSLQSGWQSNRHKEQSLKFKRMLAYLEQLAKAHRLITDPAFRDVQTEIFKGQRLRDIIIDASSPLYDPIPGPNSSNHIPKNFKGRGNLSGTTEPHYIDRITALEASLDRVLSVNFSQLLGVGIPFNNGRLGIGSIVDAKGNLRSEIVKTFKSRVKHKNNRIKSRDLVLATLAVMKLVQARNLGSSTEHKTRTLSVLECVRILSGLASTLVEDYGFKPPWWHSNSKTPDEKSIAKNIRNTALSKDFEMYVAGAAGVRPEYEALRLQIDHDKEKFRPNRKKS